ncbi:iron-containing alcohol dehydrogenase [uncultured Microbacterium sp.]|uniref:iron-containing alcohol dehydrogenase n=1 Tax=uncultured Microbacterium sp. TaxID=191216 RepID=UPI00261EE207|nr:iron-containing alcohol dehydrogenase [uncultured Microbacterium sp.]
MDSRRSFAFELATRIRFGAGEVSALPEEVRALGSGGRVLLVSDPGLVKAGAVARVEGILADAGVSFETFTDVEPEPDARGVMRTAEIARDSGVEVIVGLGGGSALDTAKAGALMVANPGHIRDYAGLSVPSSPGMPVIAIPTTAGTGSECAIWSVISEKDTNTKYGVGGRNLTASLALVDPELTVSVPIRTTIASGVDALAHALESYVNKATQPISEALAAKSMELIAGSLRRAVFDGADLTARADMSIAATMAACAFAPTRLGLSHAMAMPLGAVAKIPHGEAIAVTLPGVMRYNVAAAAEKFADIARIFGVDRREMTLRDAADAGVREVERLISDIGSPTRLSDYGIVESDLRAIAEDSMLSGNVVVNPRPATADDFVDLLRKCL